MFYVGVSRAKQNLFVVENKKLSIFENFFKENFENLNHIDAIKKLNEIVAKYEFTTEEAVNRVAEFLKQEQYENARFTANKIVDDKIRISELVKIEVYEKYISKGNYREAGVKFWENGLLDNAKQQFEISGDKILIDLIDACSQNDNTKLDIDIVKYYNDVKNNEIAKNFILETINNDLLSLKSVFKEIQSKLKIKKNKNI